MRYGMSAILAAACLVAGCAKTPPAGAPASTASVDRAGGGMTMQLNTKDGRSFDIHVPPPSGKPTDVKGVDALFDTFMEFCLEAFPDDAALATKAKDQGVRPLTAEEVSAILRGDPGEGWELHAKGSVIRLILERPPFHSCSVRALLPTEPDIGMTMATFVGLWGFTQSPQETMVPGAMQSFSTGNVVQTEQPFALIGPDKKPIEQVGAYLTHYPNSDQVELQLVRMRGNNPR